MLLCCCCYVVSALKLTDSLKFIEVNINFMVDYLRFKIFIRTMTSLFDLLFLIVSILRVQIAINRLVMNNANIFDEELITNDE